MLGGGGGEVNPGTHTPREIETKMATRNGVSRILWKGRGVRTHYNDSRVKNKSYDL